jgi:pycsar effector protein
MQKWSGQEVAWKVHESLVDHTGKVDNKAGLVLSVEVAILGAIVALTSANRIFADLGDKWVSVMFHTGFILIICAVVVAVSALAPRLHTRRSEQHWQANFVYFGHLRFWQPDELTHALREQDALDVLSRQIIDISRILWVKHRCVQISLWLAIGGGNALLTAGLLR